MPKFSAYHDIVDAVYVSETDFLGRLKAAGFEEIWFNPEKKQEELVRRYFANDTHVVAWDGDEFPDLFEKKEFVIRSRLDDLFPDAEDQFNQKFWERPVTLFHATRYENVKSIDDQGLLPRVNSRGISNRSVGPSIFTVTDTEHLLDGSYGDVIYRIDCQAMKDQIDPAKRPYVSLEPIVQEQHLRNRIAAVLGLDPIEIMSSSEGIFEETIILYEAIPPHFIALSEFSVSLDCVMG